MSSAFQCFFFTLVTCILLSFSETSAQTCTTSNLQINEIRASQTDPNISLELNTHLVFRNPDCAPQNKLVIYMVGTFDNPKITSCFLASRQIADFM